MTSTTTKKTLRASFARAAVLALIAAAAQACALDSNPSLDSQQQDLSGSASSADAALACDGATSVAVSISGASLTSVTPVDLMLVIDDSGSISYSQFEQLRKSLVTFVQSLDDLFDNGGKVGVTLFSNSARLIAPLSANKNEVLSKLQSMNRYGGATCTACGIDMARQQFLSSNPDHERVAIVLTDGLSNVGQLQTSLDAAAAIGVTFFAVGVGNYSSFYAELQKIATGEGDANVFTAEGFDSLGTTFQDLTAAIVSPEATDAELVLDVNAAFGIQGASADAGSVTLSGNTIRWSIPKIQDETVTLTYEVAHDPAALGGDKPVHTSVSYSDAEGNALPIDALSVSVSGCDSDGDGVLDEDDACAGTPAGAVVDATGCSISQLCECAGPGPDHGPYAACVAQAANAFADAGLISTTDKGALVRRAARGLCVE
jgi:uncharacterized protein YegL